MKYIFLDYMLDFIHQLLSFTHLLLGAPCILLNYYSLPSHFQSYFMSKVIILRYQLVMNYDITLQSHHINKF